MNRPEIFRVYGKLPENNPEKGTEQSKLTLREFIRNYATSLADIVKAFPKDNLDINALEAHLWDRLKTFYRYESFGEVDIETKEEAAFINEAIKLIEEWFYKGDWTSCLEIPTEEEIRELVSGRENSFLQKTRRAQPKDGDSQNLGRDGRYPDSASLPNIYEDAGSGRDLRDVYKEHAFKFFHGPAAVINTLTKIRSLRGIVANDSKFQGLIRSTSTHYRQKLQSWGYEVPKSGALFRATTNQDVNIMLGSEDKMHTQPRYIQRGQEYKRNLFFMKTALVAAEIIRRSGEGHLTKEVFENTMARLRQLKDEGAGSSEFIPFDFVADGSQSSLLHVNTRELPFAFFAVDYLKKKQNQKKP